MLSPQGPLQPRREGTWRWQERRAVLNPAEKVVAESNKLMNKGAVFSLRLKSAKMFLERIPDRANQQSIIP
jgi:hypothetical protein